MRVARRTSSLVAALSGALALSGLALSPSAEAAPATPRAAVAPAAPTSPSVTTRTVKRKKATVTRSIPSRVGRNQAMTIYVREKPAVPNRIVRIVARQSGGAWRTLGEVRERKHGKAYATVALPASGNWQVQAQLLKRKKHAKKPGNTFPVRVTTDFHPDVVAHRGGAGEATQNTLATFQRAVALGYTAVETDVQMTAPPSGGGDPALVLFHDLTFGNLTDVATKFPGRAGQTVSTFTPDEVAQLTLKGSGGQHVPLFTDLLDYLKDKPVTLHAEAKNPVGGQAEAMLAAIKQANMQSKTIVSSFDLPTVTKFKTLREADSQVASLRLSPILSTYANPAAYQGWASGITLQQPAATTANINDAHARGLQIYVWTVDDPAFFYRFADARADAIITDNPASARAAILG